MGTQLAKMAWRQGFRRIPRSVHFRAVAATGTVATVPMLCEDNKTKCDSSVPTWAVYGAAGATMVGVAGLAYWATCVESAELAKVKLSKEDRAHYVTLLRRSGEPNPDATISKLRADFAKQIAPDQEEPFIRIGHSEYVHIPTDEGEELRFPGPFFDRNADGKLDFGEYVIAYVIISEFFRSTLRSRTDIQKVMFAVMDEDGNGTIDKDELSHFMHVAMELQLVRGFKDSKTAVKHWMSMFDANGDGQIDFGEFCQLETKALDYSNLRRQRAELVARHNAKVRGLRHTNVQTSVGSF